MRDEGVRICVSVLLPWAEKELNYHYMIDRFQAQEALKPLPRNREFDPFEGREAQAQRERRGGLIDMVAMMIARALMTACESEDTDHGYRKKSKS